MKLNKKTLALAVIAVLALGKFAWPEQFKSLEAMLGGGASTNQSSQAGAAKTKAGIDNAAANKRTSAGPQGADFARLERAVANQEFEVWLDELPFEVVKILKDDLEGSQHQRFLIAAPGLPTLLVAHNIDLAPRVPLREGDQVHVRGRYEWNNKGGVIHWTHHDPAGRKTGGWVRHQGKTYK